MALKTQSSEGFRRNIIEKSRQAPLNKIGVLKFKLCSCLGRSQEPCLHHTYTKHYIFVCMDLKPGKEWYLLLRPHPQYLNLVVSLKFARSLALLCKLLLPLVAVASKQHRGMAFPMKMGYKGQKLFTLQSKAPSHYTTHAQYSHLFSSLVHCLANWRLGSPCFRPCLLASFDSSFWTISSHSHNLPSIWG